MRIKTFRGCSSIITMLICCSSAIYHEGSLSHLQYVMILQQLNIINAVAAYNYYADSKTK